MMFADPSSHWKIYQTPDLGRERETKIVWTCLQVFWFSKDNSAGHSAWKKKKDRRRGGIIILSSGQGWTLLAQQGQLKTGLGGNGLL